CATLFFAIIEPDPRLPLFPYTTLFRSLCCAGPAETDCCEALRGLKKVMRRCPRESGGIFLRPYIRGEGREQTTRFAVAFVLSKAPNDSPAKIVLGTMPGNRKSVVLARS